jgi:hypothetical protein
MLHFSFDWFQGPERFRCTVIGAANHFSTFSASYFDKPSNAADLTLIVSKIELRLR